MGLFNSIRMGSSGAADAYEIDRSLRFNDGDSPYFDLTPSAAGSNQMTFSFWVKGMETSSTKVVFSSGEVNARGHIYFSSNNLMVQPFNSSGAAGYVQTDMKFRDPSAWYHVVISLNNTTYSNMASTINIYVNGVAATFSAINSNNPSGGNRLNDSQAKHIGQFRPTSGSFFDGYLAEFNFIDGQVLDQSYFGETDAATGQWIPKEYDGTYGTEGFYLNFSDNSGTTATTLGKDTSGQGNNWTPNNFGTGDAVKDTPTNNFCTLNYVYDAGGAYGSSSISEGNLRYTGGSSNRSIGSTFGISPSDTKGYYFEGRIISGNESNRLFFGIGLTSTNWISTDARGAGNGDSWVLRNGDGAFLNNGTNANDNGATSVGQILQIAVKGSKIWVGTNNTWHASGNPAAGSNEKYSNITDTWTPVLDLMTSNVFQFNFGQDSSFSNTVTAQGNTDANGHGDFYYAPPTGFFAMCSANLPEPSILLPNKYFDILLWTGNNSSRNITGLEFDPDWVWAKNRTIAYSHEVYDTIRGNNKAISTNNSNDEFSTGGLSFGVTGGFALAAGGSLNDDSGTNDIVAWNWNAGGSTVTNNDGSISSQVRANPTAGFSIVSYTGTGSSLTVGHGLGVAPEVLIIKNRDEDGHNWAVYHSGLDFPTKDLIYLDLNEAANNHDPTFDNTAPTSSVFTAGNYGLVNGNGDKHIAYCFSEVAGYSKFGKYTGNGNADGPFIFTGFRPAWVLAKRTDSTGYWRLLDSKRDPHNVAHHALFPNTNDSVSDSDSSSSYNTDFLSNGFKLRTTLTSSNASGGTWIYLAFAESPFKYSRAR